MTVSSSALKPQTTGGPKTLSKDVQFENYSHNTKMSLAFFTMLTLALMVHKLCWVKLLAN